MSADRLHRARGTGAVHVNERDGQWFAARRDGRDPALTPLERWWIVKVEPALELAVSIGAWIGIPVAFWIGVFFFVRSLLPQVR